MQLRNWASRIGAIRGRTEQQQKRKSDPFCVPKKVYFEYYYSYQRVRSAVLHARERHLRNAPITEAVIDFQVRLNRPFVRDDLLRIQAALSQQFTSTEEQRHFEASFRIVPGHPPDTSATDLGDSRLLFKSEPRADAAIASGAGFLYSKLRPYTKFEEVRESALKLFSIYCAQVSVAAVTRVGVRYVNQFTVPRHARLADYLCAVPALPEGIDATGLSSALSRWQVSDRAREIEARTIQVVDVTPEAGTSVILDIDAFKSGMELAPNDNDFSVLTELRKLKNRIFFGSITESAATEWE